MGSIITLTVNPAIDKSISVALLVPEKKLKSRNTRLYAGGGGINVARAVKHLGGEALAIYLAGGYNGELLEDFLDRENIQSHKINIKQNTRENLTVLDETTNLQYRFGMEGAVVSDEEWQLCLEYIGRMKDVEYLVASGSLPAGLPNDFYGRVSAIAKRNNIKVIVDTSGNALKAAANEGVYLLKPNLAELAYLTGKEELSADQIVDAAKCIIAKGNCKVMIVSLGAAGALLVTENLVKQVAAPIVKRKSTVGAGDSMVAGIVLSLSRGINLLDSLKYGIACGTAATMNPGTELCKLKDVGCLYETIKMTAGI